jgi:hypothetical protein
MKKKKNKVQGKKMESSHLIKDFNIQVIVEAFPFKSKIFEKETGM